MEELTLLILGAGWTSTFLIPLLQSRNIPFAATTTTGHPVAGAPTIPFKFDPSVPEDETRSAIAALPRARYILITFPLLGTGPSRLLVEAYETTHRTAAATAPRSQFRFIQLGSTGIWQPQRPLTTTTTTTTTTSSSSSSASSQNPSTNPPPRSSSSSSNSSPWLTRHSPYNTSAPRAVAEDELLSLGGCVLNLAGLWGGARHPRNWVGRVAPSKEAARGKTSLHLVHGEDVARALVAIVAGSGGGAEDGEAREKWETAGRGQRWMVTDGWVYDWWGLMAGWSREEGGDGEGGDGRSGLEAEVSERAKWVWELMREEGVRALPRGMEALGRCYDSREFWETWGLVPVKGRVC
ncbi:hypothetical protein VTK26DRAFT_7828 [Humicola hyalothermophila]